MACSPEASPEPTGTATSSAASSSPSSTPPKLPTTGSEDLDGDATHEPLSAPTWDDAARVDVQGAAATAVAAWARPDLDYDAWWSGLSPALSESARQTFGTIDPAFIPATTVTGDAVLEDESSPWLATLLVPTDAGDVRVLMVRDGAEAPWFMERIDPA